MLGKRKRSRITDEDEATEYPYESNKPSNGHQKGEPLEYDKTTFRVRRIPQDFDAPRLQKQIIDHLSLSGPSDVKVHSIASEARYASDQPSKTATISFRALPNSLISSKSPSKPINEIPKFLLPTHADGNGCRHMSLDSHFHGFTPLAPSDRAKSYTTDCIVIHGLAAHPFGSFVSSRKEDSSYMWLRDSLPKLCPDLRIWLYGYKSDLQDEDSRMEIDEYAKRFQEDFRILRKKLITDSEPTPIMFIAHSLGGLILKRAIVQMKKNEQPDDQSNLDMIYGMMFFGVPKDGMNTNALASMLADNASIRFTQNMLDQQVGYRLKHENHQDFCDAFHHEDGIVVSFVETQKSPTVQQNIQSKEWARTGPKELLVSAISADNGRGREFKGDQMRSLDADHSKMVKFADEDSTDYDRVIDPLKSFIRDAPHVIDLRLKRRANFIESSSDNPWRDLISKYSTALQSLYFEQMDDRKDSISDAAPMTCKWLAEHPKYKEWLCQPRGLLWVKGNPGVGKSTVMRHTVGNAPNDRILASFFIHGRGSPIQKSPLGLLRSLLFQILQRLPWSLAQFGSEFDARHFTRGKIGDKWNWTLEDLKSFFKTKIMNEVCKIRIYADALDECGEDNARDLVSFFEDLTVNSGGSDFASVSICFSCRHWPIIKWQKGLDICVEKENSNDIATFINRRLGDEMDSETIVKLQDEIDKRSSGSFQWARLATDKILSLDKKGSSWRAMTKAIQGLPSELNALYANIIGDVDDRAQSLRLLKWITFAIRPLTVSELRFAMSIEIDEQYESIKQCEEHEYYVETDNQMERKILDLSRGLAEVKSFGRRKIVQFIHQTVIEYFDRIGVRDLERSTGSLRGSIHFQLSRICVAYLRLKEVTSTVLEYVQASDPGIFGWYSFADRFNSPRFEDVEPLLDKVPFLEYATLSWISHTKVLEQEGCHQYGLANMFCGPCGHHLKFWRRMYRCLYHSPRYFKKHYGFPSMGMSLLHVAAHQGLPSVVDDLLRDATTDVNLKDDSGCSPLSLAAKNGHESVVRLLLEQSDLNKNTTSNFGVTPVLFAINRGHEAIAQLLLEQNDVMSNCKDIDNISPLHLAATKGQESIVRLLLEHKDVETSSQDFNGRTALSRAARQGHKGIVLLLVKRKTSDLHLEDHYGQTPLHWAASEGHAAIAQLLIEEDNIKVERMDCDGQTPLCWAAKRGHEAVVKILIERSIVNINSTDAYGKHPLSWAAEMGHEAVVKLLIESKNVKIKLTDAYGKPPLSWAAERGREAVVKLLLGRSNVEMDSRDAYQQTPLSWAALGGNATVVQLLLEHIIGIQSKKGSAWHHDLSWAVESHGIHAVAHILIDLHRNSEFAYSRDVLSKLAYEYPASWELERQSGQLWEH